MKLIAAAWCIDSANITWSVDGPGSLVNTTGLQNTYLPPADGTTTITATVTASASGYSTSAVITIEPYTGATVSGRVMANATTGAPEIPVMIVGNAPTKTDAEGRFTIRGVATPYDLVVAAITDGYGTVMMVRGVTRLDPVVSPEGMLDGGGPVGESNASIAGALSGGLTGTLPQSFRSAVIFDAPGTSSYGEADMDGTTYQVRLGWSGTAPVTGNLHALEWTVDGNNLPTAFLGYGTKANVTIPNGGALAGQDIALGAVPADTLSGTVSKGLTQFIVGRTYAMTLGGSTLDLADESAEGIPGIGSAFSIKTPHIAGAKMQVSVMGVNVSGLTEEDMGYGLVIRNNLATDATNVALELPGSPKITAPSKSAKGIDLSTEFKWTGGAGLKLLEFSPTEPGEPPSPGGGSSSGAQLSFAIVTMGTSTTLPDVSLLGIELPAKAEYQWMVEEIAQVTSTDQFVTEGFAETARNFELVSAGVSPQRTFTTK